jgi:outer membrane immunogenic protein
MHRLVITSFAAAGLSVGLTPEAFAADLGRLAPAKAPVAVKYSWTGGYGGLSGGSSWSPDDVSTAANGNSLVPFNPQVSADAAAFGLHFPTAPKGFLGGGTLGYNVQTGQFVWGVEADLSWADIKGTSSQGATAPLPGFPPLTTTSAGVAEQKIDAFGTLRARLGFTPVDRLLVYGTGGLAYGHVESNTNIGESTNNGLVVSLTNAVGSATTWRGGWTVGAGLEYAFAPRWTAKAEYLYYDLGSISYNSSSTVSDSVGPFNTTGVTSTADFKGNIIRGGINYKFW